MTNTNNPHHEERTIWKNPITWVVIAAVGYWVYNYHLQHALGFLPYAILLLCPFMHMFGHGHHGGHGEHSKKEEE